MFMQPTLDRRLCSEQACIDRLAPGLEYDSGAERRAKLVVASRELEECGSQAPRWIDMADHVAVARRRRVPIPVFESFEALNAYLLDCCRKRLNDRLRGHDETIGERLARDLAAFTTPLPPPYEACEKIVTRVSSLSLVRYRRNDYSVPTIFGHREVVVRGYVHEVTISCWTRPSARA